MNEDDYDFDTTEKLSALFGRDHEISNSSLIYKAPKQPAIYSNNACSTSSRTFHKYIKLYNNNNGIFYGKHIIAIVTSESNSEILIYQSKKNIFIRFSIRGKTLYAHTNNYTLFLYENNQQYKLEFENDRELMDFTREYVQNGGFIEIFKESSSPHQSIQNIKISHEGSTGMDCVEASVEKIAVSISNKTEKSNILTRLEKMGLPQLLPIQKERGDIENHTIAEANTLSKMNYVKNGQNTKSSDVQKDEDLDVHCITLDEADQPMEKISVGPKFFITQEQIDLLTSVLVDNQTNNSELKEAISLLTMNLKEIIPLRELEDKNKVRRLESRIKTLELKSENLQSELKKCHEKYSGQNISNSPQNKNTCENSCQTDNLEYINEDIIQFESIIMQIMDIVKSLPLSPNEIGKFKNVNETIKDIKLTPNLQSIFKCIEEKNITYDKTCVVLRNEFLNELKRIMNDMYQNICSSEGSVDIMNLLAKQIKLATVEIMKNYDISLDQMKI